MDSIVKRASNQKYLYFLLIFVLDKYIRFLFNFYPLQQNHEIRQSAVNLTVDQISFYDQEQEAHVNNQDEVEPPNQIDCKYTIKLNGPHSPLEAQVFIGLKSSSVYISIKLEKDNLCFKISYMSLNMLDPYFSTYLYINNTVVYFTIAFFFQIYPLMRATLEKRVTMDPNSVNSVLLSTAPQYGNELLIVAAEISESHKNNSVTLRNTTIMPNIVGLPVLMTMLFCPSLKLFANKSMTKYTKLLCGLG